MNNENKLILKAAFGIANKTGADMVMVHADSLDNLTFDERVAKNFDLVLFSKKRRLDANGDVKKSLVSWAKAILTLPPTQLTRISLIKVATTLALSQEIVEAGSSIVFAVGGPEAGPLDLIQRVDTSKESEIIASRGLTKLAEVIKPEIFQAVLNLSIELAHKGREGKMVGTIFVVGDHEKVMQLSKQMIMNPFKGYEEEDRNILSDLLKETIREFSAMDGAFVIADDGTVLAAGRYLGAATDESNLPRGLGSRHIAAAGITGLTNAVAFVISESSGDVRIFKDGKIIMHIEKA